MNRRIQHLWRNVHDTTMLFTFVLWLCVLPLVLLLTVPFFGWPGGLAGAAGTFIVALIVCYAICFFPTITREEELNARRPRLR